MKRFEFTPDPIPDLQENEVFVFGSNREGKHFGGSAGVARVKYGAVWGVGEGATGQCYAFPTLEKPRTETGAEGLEPVDDESLRESFKKFFAYVENNPSKHFLLTKVGCGIAGFSPVNMGSFFRELYNPVAHSNVTFPFEFSSEYEEEPENNALPL